MIKSFFNQAINCIAVVLFVAVSFIFSNNSALASAPSSFQQTCDNIQVHGDVLVAKCLTRDQRPNFTILGLMGVENIDGTLKQDSTSQPATFQESCFNEFIEGDVLTATCLTRNQNQKTTSVELLGIENIDGNLEYTS
ncbi:MAG: CVNH domain-containing protein [Crocosphaera sp.]